MKWNNIKITIFKELRGIVRDKKSFHKILLYPIIIPVIILLFGYLFDYMDNSSYSVGINYQLSDTEKSIVEEIGSINYNYYKTLDDMELAYKNGEITGYIVKDDKNYIVYTDPSTNSGQMTSSYINSYLDSYNQLLGYSYLNEKGIDALEVFHSIIISSKSLAKDEDNSFFSIFFNLTITYVLMIIIMTCIVVSTDATSGEKERGTLETILTFPIKSIELIIGKYLATVLLGCVSGVVSYALMIPSFYLGKSLFKTFEDIRIAINASSVLLVLSIIILSAFLVAGVCFALSGKAKTYKEAQSSLQLISLLPLIPYFIKVMEVDNTLFSFIPIANCGMALNDITMNDINVQSLIIIFITTIVYTILIILFISKQYSSEETLFV